MQSSILVFPRAIWTLTNVRTTIKQIAAKPSKQRIRIGFSNFIVRVDHIVIPNSLAVSQEMVILNCDPETESISLLGYAVSSDGIKEIDVSSYLTSAENIEFDLKQHGFTSYSTSNIEELYETFRSVTTNSDVDFLSDSECRDIIYSVKVPNEIRRLVFDVFSQRATTISFVVRNWNHKDVVTSYGIACMIVFLTRSQFDKLMLLAAKLDNNFDFSSLDSAKSKKSNFQKQSLKSTLPVVAKLSKAIELLTHLDEQYRSPEIHGFGRLAGLINAGQFVSIINDIMSFLNEVNSLFIEICNEVRVKYNL